MPCHKIFTVAVVLFITLCTFSSVPLTWTGAYLAGSWECAVFLYSGSASPFIRGIKRSPSHPRCAHIPFPSDPFCFHRNHTREWSPVAASRGFHLACPSRPGAEKLSPPCFPLTLDEFQSQRLIQHRGYFHGQEQKSGHKPETVPFPSCPQTVVKVYRHLAIFRPILHTPSVPVSTFHYLLSRLFGPDDTARS